MKICIKCKESKDPSEYYGVQGDCKDCTKKRVKERADKLKENPDWVEKEKERNRLKYHRLGYKGKFTQTPEKKKESNQRYRDKHPEKIKESILKYKEKYPEKKNARNKSSHMRAEVKGNHLHHWSYNEEHTKDTIELSVKDHNIAHRNMVYDQERMMYRRSDNNTLLDTKESHLEFINEQLKK